MSAVLLGAGVPLAVFAYLYLGELLIRWMEQHMGPLRPLWTRTFGLMIWPWFAVWGSITGAYLEFWRESRRTSAHPGTSEEGK